MSDRPVLSEVVCDEIANLIGFTRLQPDEKRLAKAAYQLGIERARRVKPLAWVRSAYAWQEAYPFSSHRYTIFDRDFATWVCRFQGEVFANSKTEDEAKAACQAHHEQFILNNLEAM